MEQQQVVEEVADLTNDCTSDPEPGRCLAYIPRWFFNVTSGKCEKFIYGGCEGNGNNYHQKKQCEVACRSEFLLFM